MHLNINGLLLTNLFTLRRNIFALFLKFEMRFLKLRSDRRRCHQGYYFAPLRDIFHRRKFLSHYDWVLAASSSFQIGLCLSGERKSLALKFQEIVHVLIIINIFKISFSKRLERVP